MNKVFKRKWVLYYLISLVLLIFINYFVFNYNVLKLDKSERIESDVKNSQIKIDKNIEKDDDKYVTTGDESVIVLNLEHYVNKLKFNYDSKSNITENYVIEYYAGDGTIDYLVSSENNKNINISAVKINKFVKSIKITIYNPDVKFGNFKIDNRSYFNVYTYVFLAILLLNIFIFIFERKYISKKIEVGFLILSISTGFLFVVALPPFIGSAWDDQIHFGTTYYSFHNSDKSTKAVDEFVQVTNTILMYDTIDERNAGISKINEHHNQKTSYENIGTSYLSYKGIGYLPAAILMYLLDMINCPFSITFMLCKLLYVVIYSIVIYYAIKIIPVYKHLLCFIGLIPTSIYLAAQFNYDNMINCFMLLAMSIFVYEMYHKDKKINKKYTIIFFISMIIACFIKAVYAPLILLPLIYPETKFSSKKRCKVFKLGILLSCLFLIGSFAVPTLTSPNEVGDLRGGATSDAGQIEFIKHNPLSFIKIFSFNVITKFLPKFIGQGTISSFAYAGSINSDNLIYLSLIGIIFFTITDNSDKKLFNNYQRIYIILLILSIVSMIWLALYISFTPVGASVINGVQGRYFIPLIFISILTIKSNEFVSKMSKEKYTLILFLLTSFVLYESMYIAIIRHFCV